MERLWETDSLWLAVLEGIATGKVVWLDVADELRPVTDAGSSEMLTLALGEALEKNPRLVLKRYGRAGTYLSLCGGPDVDHAKYGTYEKAEKAVKNRIKSVESITDKELQIPKDSCLAALNASFAPLRRYFGGKK